MNRILFEKDEIVDGVAAFGGVRAEHVLKVLHGEVGQVLKTGEVNGPIGTSEIVGIGQRSEVTVKVNHTEKSLSPWIDLILAPPRPRVMKRLLPQLSALGVGRLLLVGAKKVEKDFWGATLLKEANYRPLLIDGLMQAGTSILPTLETRRNFRKFVKEELDTFFPSSPRILAHPYARVPSGPSNDSSGSKMSRPEREGRACRGRARGADATSASLPDSGGWFKRATKQLTISPPLLAIGPEGGWTDEEVSLLEEHGFMRYSLGSRILRTDTATVALLGQLMREFDR